MILDISDKKFKELFKNKDFHLPIRWDGYDFAATLGGLFNKYIEQLDLINENIEINSSNINLVCDLLLQTVRHYLNGFPAIAYSTFIKVMNILMLQPLKVYHKSKTESYETKDNSYYSDELSLFRIVRVNDNKPYSKERVFHTPYNLRAKVSTSRYSIAGYPSLYLGTTLALCCEELHINPQIDLALVSIFKIDRDIDYTDTNIRVIELGIKPQDFLGVDYNNESYRRTISKYSLNITETRSAYLLWYPLIASCSFIRINKNDPFAAEYIIPQLLMQWVRNEMGNSTNHINNTSDTEHEYEQLVGIRYFSCASVKASNMGFNYVFPTSGRQKSNSLPYCPVLAKAFSLTEPVYINEYDSIRNCEWHLERSNKRDYDKI